MGHDGHDILAKHGELKEMPYRIPDGYFESLDMRIHERISAEKVRRPLLRRILSKAWPYISAAAAIAVTVTTGILLTGHPGSDTVEKFDYGFYLANDLIPVTDPESIYLSYNNVASDTLSDEDIVNYLIESGIEPEEFTTE